MLLYVLPRKQEKTELCSFLCNFGNIVLGKKMLNPKKKHIQSLNTCFAYNQKQKIYIYMNIINIQQTRQKNNFKFSIMEARGRVCGENFGRATMNSPEH